MLLAAKSASSVARRSTACLPLVSDRGFCDSSLPRCQRSEAPSPISSRSAARAAGAPERRSSYHQLRRSLAAAEAARTHATQGGLMVAGVKIQLGHVHRGQVVTVVIEDSQFRIRHDETQLAAHDRTVIKEVTRRSASGHPGYQD
jgi:hypothetical protein